MTEATNLIDRLRKYGTGSPDSLLLMREAADKLAAFEVALRGIRRIVEEAGCRDWRDEIGYRFKDTPEWITAYLALAHSPADSPKVEPVDRAGADQKSDG